MGGPAPGVATGVWFDLSTMSKTEVKRPGLKIRTFSEHVKRSAYTAATALFAAWPTIALCLPTRVGSIRDLVSRRVLL